LSREPRDGPLQLFIRLRELRRNLVAALLFLSHSLHLLDQNLLLVKEGQELALCLRRIHLHLLNYGIQPSNLKQVEIRQW
jgi:hypothetical protein